MARARIFQQPKTAMQSGTARAQVWVLEFEPVVAARPDPLMGWIGGADTQSQVRLTFESQDEAVSYAERAGVAFDLELPQVRRIRPKSYAENFRFGRNENWTH